MNQTWKPNPFENIKVNISREMAPDHLIKDMASESLWTKVVRMEDGYMLSILDNDPIVFDFQCGDELWSRRLPPGDYAYYEWEFVSVTKPTNPHPDIVGILHSNMFPLRRMPPDVEDVWIKEIRVEDDFMLARLDSPSRLHTQFKLGDELWFANLADDGDDPLWVLAGTEKP